MLADLNLRNVMWVKRRESSKTKQWLSTQSFAFSVPPGHSKCCVFTNPVLWWRPSMRSEPLSASLIWILVGCLHLYCIHYFINIQITTFLIPSCSSVCKLFKVSIGLFYRFVFLLVVLHFHALFNIKKYKLALNSCCTFMSYSYF